MFGYFLAGTSIAAGYLAILMGADALSLRYGAIGLVLFLTGLMMLILTEQMRMGDY